jgi:hypothetical protein
MGFWIVSVLPAVKLKTFCLFTLTTSLFRPRLPRYSRITRLSPLFQQVCPLMLSFGLYSAAVFLICYLVSFNFSNRLISSILSKSSRV